MVQKGINTLVHCLAICITITHARPPSKIINGQYAWVGEFPYQVSIQRNGEHHCGGSIIDPIHILTAAHCLVEDNFQLTTNLVVITGTNDIYNRPTRNTYNIAKQIYHPNYDAAGSGNHDIGMVKLARPITFNTYQQPINLPSKPTSDGTQVMACGWGAQIWDPIKRGTYSKQLHKLSMTVVNNQECQRRWNQQTRVHAIIRPNHLCVLPTAPGNSGLCFGDSGSPLVQKGEVVGVVSYGIPCAQGYPDIFTRVYSYLPWIKSVMAR